MEKYKPLTEERELTPREFRQEIFMRLGLRFPTVDEETLADYWESEYAQCVMDEAYKEAKARFEGKHPSYARYGPAPRAYLWGIDAAVNNLYMGFE